VKNCSPEAPLWPKKLAQKLWPEPMALAFQDLGPGRLDFRGSKGGKFAFLTNFMVKKAE